MIVTTFPLVWVPAIFSNLSVRPGKRLNVSHVHHRNLEITKRGILIVAVESNLSISKRRERLLLPMPSFRGHVARRDSAKTGSTFDSS
ncbi:hypothetical protein SUGI_0236610 [Cryptomeria japonica]|nr:hypothetical protein SUGI_0236610 [Cryptomeria japonica]